MEFPAHIVFSCLLVCQPAIFVDSKRDGTGAAHGRKGFRMKRAELDRRIVFPLMEVEPTICIELKNEEDEG